MSEITSIIQRLERQRAAIDRALLELREIENTEGAELIVKRRGRPPGKKSSKKTRGGKRVMSAEGRARIAEAARRRWAEINKAKAAAEKAPARKKRAGRKRASE